MKITFTHHAIDRAIKRKVLRIEILDAIKFPDEVFKTEGKYYFRKRILRGRIEVCCEKTERNINVITLYWV